MSQQKINWQHHVNEFRNSSKSAARYCAEAGLKYDTFRYHLNKSRVREPSAAFSEYSVCNELIISRDQNGSLTLRGFDVESLPQIVGAWSNALSR